MQGIYKIENLINGKCYVGQSVDIEKRFSCHKRDSHNINLTKYNYPLYNSMRKNGMENFSFEVLEHVKDKEALTDRELYWYYKLKPKYNILLPNRTNTKNKRKVIQIDYNTRKPIREYESITAAAKATNSDSSSISKACKGKLYEIAGFLWCYSDQINNWEMPTYRKINIPVKQLDSQTKQVIKIYDNARIATEETGVQFQNIQKVCAGLRNKAGGFAWEYAV